MDTLPRRMRQQSPHWVLGCTACAPSYCGWSVDLDRHTARGSPRRDQFERPIPSGVREQPRALADDHGEGEQGDFIDKVVFEQPPKQGTAAVHLQLTARLGFQFADGGRELTGEDGRVLPPRVGKCGRYNVLRLRVQ